MLWKAQKQHVEPERRHNWRVRRRTTADSLHSLNEHLRHLKLDSVADEKDQARPPPYSTAAQDVLIEVSSHVNESKDTGAIEINSTAGITEEELLDRATTFIRTSDPQHPAGEKVQPKQDEASPSVSPTRPLAKPVLIPRLDPGPTVPFARAWAPSLLPTGISESDFVAFIDNLNLICTPHAALKVLELAAFGVSFVPLDYADGLSAAMALIAMATAAAIAVSRRKKYFARLNDGFFHPRGLHVRVVGNKKMRSLLGIPKGEVLVQPLSEETLLLTVQERCLKHMEKYAAPLVTEGLPPPRQETQLLARLSAWRINWKIRQAEKCAKRTRKKAWKRVQGGKKPREGSAEKSRVKYLSWIMVQNLEDYEAEVRAKEAAKKEKKARKFGISMSTKGEN